MYNDHPWDPKIVVVADRGYCSEVIYVLTVPNGNTKW